MCGLDEVWRADLDGNGTQDYVFFGVGPYFNGRMTPVFSLSILLMDTQGLPVPFFTVVYHGENGAGIKHVVDLDRDGRAELLISTYDENPSDTHVGPFCSGHWTNQLYRFTNYGVEEIRGTIGGRNFPFVHDWTYRDTQCTKEEKPVSSILPPTLYEHGTSTRDELVTTLRESNEDSSRIAIAPVGGCRAICPHVVLYDRSQIRQIAFPNLFNSYDADLLDAIRRDGVAVKLRGVDRWMGNGDCSVNLMWAAK